MERTFHRSLRFGSLRRFNHASYLSPEARKPIERIVGGSFFESKKTIDARKRTMVRVISGERKFAYEITSKLIISGKTAARWFESYTRN